MFTTERFSFGTSTSAGRSHVACLDARTGAIRWRFNTVPDPKTVGGGAAWTAPALDVGTGAPLWTYQLPPSRRGGIAISNGTFYTSCGGQNSPPYTLYAFSIDGG